MKKIKSMPAEKWVQVPKIRQRLIDLESTPLDEDKAAHWIGKLYESIDRAVPEVLFFDSPLAMHLGISCFRNSIGGQLRGQLWDQLWDQLGDQLRDQLGGQLRGQLRDQLSTQWMTSYLGWFYGAKLAGAKLNKEEFSLYQGYLENVSLVLPFERVVFASRRPIEIHWQDGLLHNESGSSVLYADGFSVYSIDGVRVDEQIVMHPETQTLEQINNEGNEEIKRIRISRYGWHRYLEEMKANVVDVSTPVHWMESLMECQGMKILCTYDPSTGRPYALEVDPSCQTCEQAQRYLLAPEIALKGLGISPDQANTYPIFRT